MTRSFLIVFLLTCTGVVTAETIAVIGTGDVGSALGPEFAQQGHTVIYGSRKPDRRSVRALVEATGRDARASLSVDAVKGADIVVLAVPGLVVADVVGSLGDHADDRLR
ncbi:MAG: NAD(P)-binding domain-containing protein, partial [Woeseiaceae bacterium]